MARSRSSVVPKLALARGLLQAGVGATVGITSLAEAVHLAVLSATPWSPARPLTRGVYAGVRGLAGVAGNVGERLLGIAGRGLLAPGEEGDPSTIAMPPGLRSALNGVAGDRLARMGNPLALPMSIEAHGRHGRRRPRAGKGRVLFIHGLCMHDRHWQAVSGTEICFGRHLQERLDLLPLYLRYNSGLSIAENGRALATLLQRRYSGRRAWDGPLHLVAHSLGGLLVRSALSVGLAESHAWTASLGEVVFLGTPHEGAPLERLGKSVESLLAVSRFSAPWAALDRLRSVAIHQLGEAEVPPLGDAARSVRFHAVAGRIGALPHLVGEAWGDGLVPVSSALASRLPASSLPLHSRRVFPGIGHLALIRHPQVADHLTGVLGGSA